MATLGQIQEWRALRGRFLSALWDAEDSGIELPVVSDLLAAIGASDLSDHQIERLVRTLNYDGFISDLTMGGIEEQQIRLTTEGRYEVEQWLAEPDEPTAALPLPANQAFHIETMNVTGTVMQASTATNVNTNFGASGTELVELVTQFRQLLAGADMAPDDREAIEADLEVIEEEATVAKPRWARLRPFLRRLRGVLEKGALAGIEVSMRQDATRLIDKAEHAIAALQ